MKLLFIALVVVKSLSMSTGIVIDVPKRSTVSDLVQHVMATDAATREASSFFRAASGGMPTQTAASVARFPSQRAFWAMVRDAVAGDPIGSQEPPLFLLNDTVTKDSLTINQQLLQQLVEAYETRGPPPSQPLSRTTHGDGRHVDASGLVDSATPSGATSVVSGRVGGGAAGIYRHGGAYATANDEDDLQDSKQQPPVASPRAKSSLLTVSVTASSGQLRTFRAGTQFWEHVLLCYHKLMQKQALESSDAVRTGNALPAASSAVDKDELALLKRFEQDEADRTVLTVTCRDYDASQRSQDVVSSTPTNWSMVGGGMMTQEAAQRFANGSSPTTPRHGNGDEKNRTTTTSKRQTLQLLLKEWKDIVREWNELSEPLVGRFQPPPSTAHSDSQRFLLDSKSEDSGAERLDGRRPRGFAVVDPSTTEDLVIEARERMRAIERQSGVSAGSTYDAKGKSLYWTHFMSHWKVLEAQYRNYL